MAGAVMGLGAGVGAGLLLPPAGGPSWPLAPVLASLLVLAAVPLAVPRPRPAPAAPRRRPPKLLTRLVPAALAAAAVGQALAAPAPARLAAAALGVIAAGWALDRYRRRGPDRNACGGCPAGPPGPRCPGLAPMVRRERALSRLAGRWIARALPAPPGSPSP